MQAWARPAPADLVVAGTAPDEAAVERLGVADRVRFVGWISGTAKHDLLASARLAVVPSRHETFGLVAVEALASGTPVLAFDIPCLRDLVSPEVGCVVPAFDVQAFADQLVARYRDPDRLLEQGRGGRVAARAFDWDTLAARQAEVYEAAATLRGYGRRAGSTPRIATE